MKCHAARQGRAAAAVTPHAGVRIEIIWALSQWPRRRVTPHAGVRIEMPAANLTDVLHRVTPHAGVRIEIRSP